MSTARAHPSRVSASGHSRIHPLVLAIACVAPGAAQHPFVDGPEGGSGIRAESHAADGTVVFRLTHGQEVGPGERAVGYSEALLSIRPSVVLEDGALRVELGATLTSLVNQEPANLATLSWGFKMMDWSYPSQIIQVMALRVDGQSLQRLPGDARFEPPAVEADARMVVDLRLTYVDRSAEVSLPVGRPPVARVRLRDAQLRGAFVVGHAAPEIPFLPHYAVDVDGHVIVRLPADAMYDAIEPSLRVWRTGADGRDELEFLQRIDPDRIDAGNLDGIVELRIDELVDGWWSLPPARRRLTVSSGPEDGEPTLHARSPWLEPRDQHAALRRRLETWSGELFDLPFAGWWRHKQKDAAAAKQLLWRGVWRHSAGMSCSVVVDNPGDDPDECTPLDIELWATLVDGERMRLDVKPVLLSGRHARAGVVSIAPGAHATVSFAPSSLASDPQALRNALEGFESVEVVAVPGLIGNPYVDRLVLRSEPLPWGEPALVLGLFMHNHHPDALIDEHPYAEYAKVLDEASDHSPGATILAARATLEARYDEFVALADAHVAQLANLGGTDLDALSVLLDGHVANGYLPRFVQSDMPSITAHGGTPGETVNTLTLTHSTGEVALAIASAMVVPGLSYSDMEVLLADLDTPAAGDANRRAAEALAGRDFWAGTRPVVVNELDDERVTRALAPLMDRGVIRLPPKAKSYLQDNNFNSMQGYLFEEIALDSFVRVRLESLNRWASEGETYVLIRGDQITCSEANRQLTDGLIVRVDHDGTLSIEHVINCKSGQHGADDMAQQMKEELRRLADGFTVRDLTADQRRVFGVDQTTLALDRANCAAEPRERLFIAVTPADVRPSQNLPDGPDDPSRAAIAAALRRPQRLAFSQHEIKCATQLAFARNGVVAHAWDELDQTFRQFLETTRRTAKQRGMELPDDAFLLERYGRGERLHPTAAEPWITIVPRSQAPLIGPDEILAEWARCFPDASDERRAEAERRARLGHRFIPETRRFQNPMSEQSELRIVDPRNPFEHPDAVVAWMRLYRPDIDAAQVRQNLADGQIFDPDTNEFRKLAEEWEDVDGKPRRKLDEVVRTFRRRSAFDGPLEFDDPRTKQTLRNIAGNAAEELVQMVAAGAGEWVKMRGNTLEVRVTTNSSSAIASIGVSLSWTDSENKKRRAALPPAAARSVIASWYERHLPDGVTPAWMEHVVD